MLRKHYARELSTIADISIDEHDASRQKPLALLQSVPSQSCAAIQVVLGDAHGQRHVFGMNCDTIAVDGTQTGRLHEVDQDCSRRHACLHAPLVALAAACSRHLAYPVLNMVSVTSLTVLSRLCHVVRKRRARVN